ncbi:hypothetical protein BTA51_05455 [Hahella sp. CCB-MM4]|uniref:3-keto-5-aminohexanoate cleavage protein n=1 Tax=Hahella sp. (strain CCB-MM4) TaxID=1926491 RepID=UPI000B9A1907|nr:3-keto-5-aminohexanoate cleavage protein [Hahella sp. CCB-MM4]OZG74455.1 hypothetical protein BTA51_05455 [Hahella sp. CCB-MM4]
MTVDPTLPPALIIVAPNGARRGRDDHGRLPLSPDDMAECAALCQEAGAAMIHMHARDDEGRHSLDPDLNRRFIDRVKDTVGDNLIIQMTTEAVGQYTPAQQMASVRKVIPDAVSLAIAELLPVSEGEGKSMQGDRDIQGVGEFLAWVSESGILPQYILYDVHDVQRYHQLKMSGFIPSTGHHLLFVIGRRGQGSPADLATMLAAHCDDTPWAVCGFGALEYPVCMGALAMGGDVRVGFENNLLLNHGDTAPDNAALVQQVAGIARQLNRPILNALEARHRLLK